MDDSTADKREKINWKAALNHTLVGPSVVIKALPLDEDHPQGYMIKARKLSVEADNTIRSLGAQAELKLKGSAFSEIWNMSTKGTLKIKGKDGKKDDKKVELNDPRVISAIFNVLGDIAVDLSGSTDRVRLLLLYGIAEHNFYGNWCKPDDHWVSECLEFSEGVQEMVQAVYEKNPFLVQKTPPK